MGKLTPEEIKTLIRASQIAREKGIKLGASVKEICEQACISRKTGYQWLKEDDVSKAKKEEDFQNFVHREVDHQKLLKDNTKLRFENEGLHIAMEIHGVKKNSI